MLDIPLVSSTSGWVGVAIVLLIAGCQHTPNPEPPVELKLHQKWELQPGDTIANYSVLGGLGDLSINTQGKAIYAPFHGTLRRDTRNCTLFASPEVPAYQFRLCGLSNPRFGDVAQGDSIGTANSLNFAALRKQPDGTWAIVEPSKTILHRTLSR